MPQFVHRITKYDPADRDKHGRYIGDEDTSSDHGPVESAYLQAVAAFVEEAGVDRLTIREPEISGYVNYGLEPPVEGHGLAGLFPPGLAGYHDGAQVPLPVGLELVRAMLRDNGAWCRLEVDDVFTVHVGYDQYVYVGSDTPCDSAQARTRALGLFPERMDASPWAFDPEEADEPGEQRPADEDFWERLRWCVITRQAALLQEGYVANASRWHRLTVDGLDEVRARLTARARLTVWPDLSTDVDAVLAALPDEGPVVLVRADGHGVVTGMIADYTDDRERAELVADARTACALSLHLDEDRPLFGAVLPDSDGVLRARWRTEPTQGDRDWAFLKTLHAGRICTGTVTAIPDFGVTFVDIGGFTAMINIPELSWRHVDHPSDVVTVGQRISARILDVDMSRERVSMSLKALQEDPMPAFAQRVGQVVTGVVTRLVPFGALVRVEDRPDGLEGLVHLAGPADGDTGRPEDVVRVGDILTVKVVAVDLSPRRISLSRVQEPAGAGPA
ncbi:S1 RNA-binding domain-containing protein [Streptomyces sp. NPDC091265]|uniref:S1 RNA-binding domain-containing protein n=1 Tax=unclassified Streptomyces TaxID=2593676 RepID=UPI00344EA74C